MISASAIGSPSSSRVRWAGPQHGRARSARRRDPGRASLRTREGDLGTWRRHHADLGAPLHRRALGDVAAPATRSGRPWSTRSATGCSQGGRDRLSRASSARGPHGVRTPAARRRFDHSRLPRRGRGGIRSWYSGPSPLLDLRPDVSSRTVRTAPVTPPGRDRACSSGRRIYRLVVIGTGGHVVAVRRLLTESPRRVEARTPATAVASTELVATDQPSSGDPSASRLRSRPDHDHGTGRAAPGSNPHSGANPVRERHRHDRHHLVPGSLLTGRPARAYRRANQRRFPAVAPASRPRNLGAPAALRLGDIAQHLLDVGTAPGPTRLPALPARRRSAHTP